MTKTIVCVIGQARAHDITWEKFKSNVLDELKADLAICIDTDPNFDFANPFYRNAQYRWFNPPYKFGEYDKAFDAVQKFYGFDTDWRILHQLDGTFLGGISPHKTVAAILYYNRWVLLQNILAENLLNKYDRFVITRSDYLFSCPHPKMKHLDSDYIWIPDGEDWGGYCDRHMVLSADRVGETLNMMEPLLRDPQKMYEKFSETNSWNIEKYIKAHIQSIGADSLVRRYPYSMFLVRGEKDSSTWNLGSYSDEARLIVKYANEYSLTKTFSSVIKNAKDWERFFRLRDASRAIFMEAIAAGISGLEDPRVGTAMAEALGGLPYWSDIRHELIGEEQSPKGKLREVLELSLEAVEFDADWYRRKNGEVSHFDDAALRNHWRGGGYFEARAPRERWGWVGLADRLMSIQLSDASPHQAVVSQQT